MALPSSGAISASAINTELGKSLNSTFSFGSSNSRNLSDIASGAISLSNFFGKSLMVSMSGSLFYKEYVAPALVYSMTVDTGYQSTGYYPTAIRIGYAGHQQDSSCQQMQRKLTIYKPTGVGEVVYDTTSALCNYFSTSGFGYKDGTQQYNRIVGYVTGKVSTGTKVTVQITNWIQAKFVVV